MAIKKLYPATKVAAKKKRKIAQTEIPTIGKYIDSRLYSMKCYGLFDEIESPTESHISDIVKDYFDKYRYIRV